MQYKYLEFGFKQDIIDAVNDAAVEGWRLMQPGISFNRVPSSAQFYYFATMYRQLP